MIKLIIKWISCIFIYYTGLLWLSNRLNLRLRSAIWILFYHRILDDKIDIFNLSISQELFERQLVFLKKYYKVVSLKEVAQRIYSKRPFEQPVIVLTFDDGYRNLYTHALALLRKYRLPATVFLATGYINTDSFLWFDDLAISVLNTQVEELVIDDSHRYILSDRPGRIKAIKNIAGWIGCLPESQRAEILDKLHLASRAKKDGYKDWGILNWEQARELLRNGIEIGSHSVSHTVLTHVYAEELSNEIASSKEIIERNLGQKVTSFAYPSGGPGEFNEDIKEKIKQSGYHLACTTILGPNFITSDPFSLRRRGIEVNSCINPLGKFSKAVFAVTLSGILDRPFLNIKESFFRFQRRLRLFLRRVLCPMPEQFNIKINHNTAAVLISEPGKNSASVLTNFVRTGIKTYILYNKKTSLVCFSRFGNKIYAPAVDDGEEKFIDFLIGFAKGLKENLVLYPTFDLAVLAILKYKRELEAYNYIIPYADYEVTEKLVKKDLFYRTLQQKGINHPSTVFIEGIQDIEDLKINYPCILKPVDSYCFSKKFGVKCIKVNSIQQLLRCYKALNSLGYRVFVQEDIPGNYFYSFYAYLNRESKVLGICGYEKLRQYPMDFGTGTFCQNHTNKDPIGLALEFLKGIDYHGIADIEFKLDSRDSSFKLFDINARISLQSRLASFSGVNIEYLSFMDAKGEHIPEQVLPKSKMKWFCLIEDFITFLKPGGYLASQKLTFRDWLNSYHGKKIFCILDFKDPLPFIIDCLITIYNIAKSLLSRLFKKQSLFDTAKQRKLKLLFIIDGFNVGGAERQLYQLILGLDRDLFYPAVCILGKQDFYFSGVVKKRGIECFLIDQKGKFDISTLKNLYVLLKRYKPDIVHTWLFTADSYGRLAAILTGVPFIISSQRSADISKKKRHIFLDRILAQFTDKLVANAQAVKDFLIQRARIPDNKILTIYNGVDMGRFTSLIEAKQFKESLMLPPDKLLVGMIANFNTSKNHKMFIELARRIVAERKDVHFMLIGEGITKEDMKNLVYSYGLEKDLTFLGFRFDIEHIINILDISVLFSFYEGCSNVILESMALGKPVLATNVGGNSELVLDGETGYLIPPKDIDYAVEKTRLILDNLGLRQDLGCAGRYVVQQKFSLDKLINQTQGLYLDLGIDI